MTNIRFKKQPRTVSKISNIAVIGNDPRFSRMLELEFIRNGYNCKNFNISNDIEGKNNYYFSDILNYCVDLQCSLIVLIPDKLGQYEKSYGEFINLAKKTANATIIFILNSKASKIFTESILAKNNVITVNRPFDVEQFFKEIKVFLSKNNRVKRQQDKSIQINDLTIDEMSRTAQYKSEQIPLTKKEFDLLLLLARRRGEALNRQEIFAEVWGFEHIGDTNVVDVFIKHLRGKIDQKYRVKFIHTVRGIGYMIKNK